MKNILKNIRDQVETLIKNPTQTTSSDPSFVSLDLQPIFYKFFSKEAQDIIANNKTQHLLHQWNKQIGNSKYSGSEAYNLGHLLEKLKIKSHEHLFVSNYIREVSKVHYFGWTVEENKLSEAALAMVNMFNDLCSKNLIRAVLTPLMSIKLVDGKHVVVSYFAIDQVNEHLVQSIYGQCQFKEGDMPPEFK